MQVTHTKVSAKSDGGDATLVRPSDWNADHTITGLDGVQASADYLPAVTISSGTGVLVTTGSVSLAAGLYVVMARCRPFTAGSPSSPGNIRMRKDGTAFGPQNDMRGGSVGTVEMPDRSVFWTIAHAGGSTEFDLLFTRESGTTVFGNGDARFSSQILAFRIGA